MRTNKIHIALLTLAFLLAVGCKKKEVIFTFSPEQPRAGQTVTFTNGTSEGEKWEWTFGDGTSSASKNPSKVYRKAGSYTVTLKVDGKNNLTYTQSLTVVDTVPRIELAEDSMVYYYHPVKLRMSAYNPYSYEKTYLWVLNDSVELLEGDLDDEQITVIFKQHDVNVEVGCLLSIGDAYFVCEQTFFVNDTTAPALFMSPKEVYGLCYQRIFPYGVEEPKRYMTSVEQVDAFFGVSLWPESGVVEGDYMYLFFSKDTPYPYGYGEDMITAFNLTTHRDANLITSSPLSAGTLHDGMVYWVGDTDGIIYRLPASARHQTFTPGMSSPLYWTDVTRLGFGLTAGQRATGLAWYNDVCMIAYGTGIYRFTQTSPLSATEGKGAILTDVAVKRFAIDAMARKIYYLTSEGLHVCNINGSNARLITGEADGSALCIDNAMNRVYWSQHDGVYYLPLIQASNNASTDVPMQLNEVPDVYSIVLDPTPRK